MTWRKESRIKEGRKVCVGVGVGVEFAVLCRVVREGREHLTANGFVSRSKGGDGINHAETWGKSIL